MGCGSATAGPCNSVRTFMGRIMREETGQCHPARAQTVDPAFRCVFPCLCAPRSHICSNMRNRAWCYADSAVLETEADSPLAPPDEDSEDEDSEADASLLLDVVAAGFLRESVT